LLRTSKNDDFKERDLHEGLPTQGVSLLVGLVLTDITPEFQNVRAAVWQPLSETRSLPTGRLTI